MMDMNSLVTIVISVLIAGFIGGITNHVAIKMLFHPRYEWRIWGFRVPFTPGLIPKRRDEIARSLGRVVAEYLVTSNGLTELIRRETFKQTLVDKLTEGLGKLAESDLTIGEIALRYWQEDKRDEQFSAISLALNEGTRRGLNYLWREQGVSRLRIGSLVSDWSQESQHRVVRKAADYIADTVKQELNTSDGERLVLKLTTQLIEQAGGFLGAMATIFMDEGKLAAKLRQSLLAALEGPVVRGALERFIQGQLDNSLQMTLGELASHLINADDVDEELIRQAGLLFRWEDWARQASEKKVGEWVAGHQEWLTERIPVLVAMSLRAIEPHVERIFSTLRLENLVEEQVRDFPIERIEGIILNISGREFKAITWLGVLLGATIGLVQVLLLRWLS
jgi:uncharacterized membrane protein YheB (UPF0754 family)